VRGLCDGASKQKLAELNTLSSPHLQIPSIPITPQMPVKHGRGGGQDQSSILAARLARMVENPNPKLMDIQEQLALAARSIVPPPMKKPRKVRFQNKIPIVHFIQTIISFIYLLNDIEKLIKIIKPLVSESLQHLDSSEV